MSQIIDQAEELRTQAIALLLEERETINSKLAQLGWDGAAPVETRKSRACSKCGQAGHNAKSCPNLPSGVPTT
jgi:hypothetical protein